jgi:hypothetical protein
MKYAPLALVVLSVGCSTIREELPTSSSSTQSTGSSNVVAPVPVVVVPVPVPVPTTGPAPAPTNPAPSNPTPSNPTPTTPGGGGNGGGGNGGGGNGGGGGGNGGASGATQIVTAGVHSYLRKGRLVPTGGTEFQVGDTIYLNCTPRDENRNPINNHGPLQAWFVSGDAAHTVTDTHTFNPDLHAQGPGKVNIACRVDNITSATTRLNITQP